MGVEVWSLLFFGVDGKYPQMSIPVQIYAECLPPPGLKAQLLLNTIIIPDDFLSINQIDLKNKMTRIGSLNAAVWTVLIWIALYKLANHMKAIHLFVCFSKNVRKSSRNDRQLSGQNYKKNWSLQVINNQITGIAHAAPGFKRIWSVGNCQTSVSIPIS